MIYIYTSIPADTQTHFRNVLYGVPMTSFIGTIVALLLVVLHHLLLLQTTATVVHPHNIFSTLTADVVLPSDGKNTIEESSKVTPHSESATANRDSKQLVLVIDVDNTLYNEKEKGIERQIAQNIYKFCQQRLNYTKEYCDQLHHEYGSTVEGIRHNLLMRNKKHSFHNNGRNITNTADHMDEDVDAFLIETLQEFYQEVYDNVDVTSLLRFSHGRLPDNTGYLHDVDIDAKQSAAPLVQLLQSPLPCPVYLASNSPRQHVLKVLSALGLRKCNFAGILTPDHRHHNNRTTVYTSFPTKSSPHIFFDSLFTKHPLDQHRVILLDDSIYSLQKAAQCGIHTILIRHSDNNDTAHSGIFGVTLQQGLGYALQHNSNSLDDNSIGRNIITTSSFPSHDDQGNNQTYKFSDIRYLQSKNRIDALSINDEVWNRLIKEVSLLNLSNEGDLHVVDLGCGLLSMLQSLLDGLETERETGTSNSKIINNKNSDNTYIRSNNLQGLLLSTMTSWVQRRRKTNDHACVTNKTKATSRPSFVDSIPSIKEMHYYAYEVNQNLLVPCQEKLRNMGFLQVQNTPSENNSSEYIFTGSVKSKKKETIAVRVYLRFRNFASDTVLHPIHLLIGCCFADLFDSETLSKEILRFVLTRDTHVERNVLMYFPITYAGTTTFLPPSPIDDENNIPSDTIAFRLYSESLANRHGQCVDATRFADELEKVGAELVAKRSSNWNIDPNRHSYLWETLLHFFEKCTFPELMLHRWNATGWIDRARTLRPSVYVSNVDLLFRLQQSTVAYQNLKNDIGISQDEARKNETVKEIIFTSRQKVEVVEKNWSLLDDDDEQLGPDFIELESICSLISSGTELKIFNGVFEEAQPLDVGIKEMKYQTMAYPMRYGYSLVGRIRRCGSNVSSDVVGKLAFAFSCHSSRTVVHKDSIQLIPSGIAPEDAIFFPSVETALSVVHDANIRVGENVAVFGQGLIGLLVTHILSLSRPRFLDGSARFGTITVLDTMPDRLAVASLLGASQALLPPDVARIKAGSFFDVCIEVSGNERALQSAIDSACDGGRIIIASWYGNASVRLNLGTAFHRSHKTLIASQVSRIPGHLQMTWTKPRRFALAWELLRAIRPSKHLLTKVVEIEDAQAAYELLNSGKEVAIAIKY